MHRFGWLALLVLASCGESHVAEDGGRGIDAAVQRDAGSRDAVAARDAPLDDCPPIGPPRCVDATCCRDEAAAVLQPGCRYECPSGFVVDFVCDPADECGDFASPCSRHDECTLAINDCCGPCGVPGLDDYDAILISRADDHRRSVCAEDDPVACPECATLVNPALGATCREGRCQEYDVRALPLSACAQDDECRLRVRDCCECGGDTSPFALIAVRVDSTGDYAGLVCDDLACPECEPTYPDTVEAYCAGDGHCAVRAVEP